MNIAILALYPDAGHIAPLLKNGAMLVARRHEVICLLPNECSALTSSYGLTNTQIGPALSMPGVIRDFAIAGTPPAIICLTREGRLGIIPITSALSP